MPCNRNTSSSLDSNCRIILSSSINEFLTVDGSTRISVIILFFYIYIYTQQEREREKKDKDKEK